MINNTNQMVEPLYEELPASNVNDLIKMFADKNDLMILSSSMHMDGYGRYSFICFDSFWSFSSKGQCSQDPFSVINEKLNEYQIKKIDGLPPLQGGAVGYFGYEASHYLEELPEVVDNINLPDIYLNFYSSVISIDHATNQCWVVATGFPETLERERLRKARKDITKIKKMCRLGLGPTSRINSSSLLGQGPTYSNFIRETYVAAVNITKNYILDGDIFEANLSQQFNATLSDDTNPLDLYFNLMRINPAPFSAFIKLPNQGYIISASPERFIKLTDHLVETCPIKGTRKRSTDPQEDKRLANELLASEKDHAENVMIVDLMRNDISRVCHSVNVEELSALKSFETVHHLVSKITGILKNNVTTCPSSSSRGLSAGSSNLKSDVDPADKPRDDEGISRPEQLQNYLNAIDLIKATFPPGSVTGAPKIRAMEIISELEKQARGPYCGCLGYLSFTGDMDTSVIIRSYFINQTKIFFSAGGAIVMDSNPEDEYQESLTKAGALIKALSL